MRAFTSRIHLVFLSLPCLLVPAATLAAQPGHRIFSQRNRFYLENLETRQVGEFDMWSIRLANAMFDRRFTDRIIANLDDYLRYGVNTLSVGIQGGNMGSSTFNKRYPRVYNADGTLKLTSPVWANLKRLLAETDRRGMVLIIQYWYFKREQYVAGESAALEATRRTTRWLKDTGHRNYILDLVNEFGHSEYSRKPLFTTVNGALKLLNAVYEVDPDVLAGMSPPSRLFSPEGYLATSRGKTWVASTVTFSHNRPADPRNGASYFLHGLPRDPLGKPYVNDEFNTQLGYERYPKRNPRTRFDTYGHWDAKTASAYVADIKKVRSLGGYANVFAHRLQYLTHEQETPIAEIGPAGTQPESSVGGGEPSLHWLFQAIAEIRKLGPVARRHDFNAAGGDSLETDLAGTWTYRDGELRQEDANHPLAWARVSAPDGDLQLSFEARFLSDPGERGRLGVQLGAASPAGPAYRLLIGRSEIRLDQVAGRLPAAAVRLEKRNADQYTLAFHDRRITVKVNGRTVIDLEDVAPAARKNLLLLTREAAAAFDNLRVGPIASVTFDDGRTGEWLAGDPKAWEVVPRTPTSPDKVWVASAGANEVRHATLDRRLDDFQFGFDADLRTAVFTALRFRARGLDRPFGDGYLLRIMREGAVALDRIEGTAPPKELAYTWATFHPDTVRVRVAVEGQRVRVLLDGKLVIDVTDSGLPLDPGGLALLAYGGSVRFDNLRLETGPNQFPRTGFEAATLEPLGAGFTLRAWDPDGGLDFADLRLHVDKGDAHGFQDVTFVLQPRHGLFQLTRTRDGKGAAARLTRTIAIGPRPWTVRLLAVDRSGNTTVTDHRLATGPSR